MFKKQMGKHWNNEILKKCILILIRTKLTKLKKN
jgi:hypothetical protein